MATTWHLNGRRSWDSQVGQQIFSREVLMGREDLG